MNALTPDQRIRRAAALADVQQKLLAPVSTVVEYADILREQSVHYQFESVLEDTGRILSAAQNLYQQSKKLLNPEAAKIDYGSENDLAVEKQLRHDLRTPINAIKGYTEMILEDTDELGVELLKPDLEMLLLETNRLLSSLGDIVNFSSEKMTAAISTAMVEDSIGSLNFPTMSSHTDKPDAPLTEDEIGRILVVDDMEDNRNVLSRRIQRVGHQAILADGGRAALDILSEQDIDLVLLDLMMPDMNGFEVLAAMKTDEKFRDIPVIIVSAFDETDSAIKCIEAGANDYLSKPVNSKLLQARIRSGLELKFRNDEERRQKKYIREAFQRFMAPAVVEQLVQDPSRLKLGGERVEITALFTDIAGFTSTIESTDPNRILPLLNRYLDGMSRIVLDHDGTIDKIVGDALHVFFGAPVSQEDHAERAVNCAIELFHYSQAFANEDESRELDFGKTRIGVHTGYALVGNFGGDSYFDYTAHGDSINTTARMEAVNKLLGTWLCVSAETAAQCPKLSWRPIGQLKLKGKEEVIDAVEPVSICGSSDIERYFRCYKMMASGVDTARDEFASLAMDDPDDPLARFHAARLNSGRGIDPVINASPESKQTEPTATI